MYARFKVSQASPVTLTESTEIRNKQLKVLFVTCLRVNDTPPMEIQIFLIQHCRVFEIFSIELRRLVSFELKNL